MILPDKLDIAIIAPFPTESRVKEGWMSRIAAIDTIVESRRRIYINFAEHHLHGRDDKTTQLSNNGWEICLSPSNVEHQLKLDEIINSVQIVYVHTIHLAEHIQPWLRTGKIIVDFHGIVPEEEAMLGRPELSKKYETIEKEVLHKARTCVMVTDAMRKHYHDKYPAITPTTIILPIVEPLPHTETHLKNNQQPELPVSVVYAGGIQAWQNINGMLDLAITTSHFANFTFLSHEWSLIKRIAQKKSCPTKTSFKFCAKSELISEYFKYNFGLVLRDETPVNTVACPTKLYEYLATGLIPIVRSPSLGDFLELGYAYVTENELSEGFFPDSVSRKEMISKNLDVVYSMNKMFLDGARRVQLLVE